MSKGEYLAKCKQIAISCIHRFVVVLLLGAISWLMMVALPNWSLLDPLSRSFDSFSFTDFYYSLYRNSDEAKPNDRIVIIDVSNKTRSEIATTIEAVVSCTPVVVGIDIIFDRPTGDTIGTRMLCESIARNAEHLVAIGKLTGYDVETDQFAGLSESLLDTIQVGRGYSNLKNIGEGGFVRDYTVARYVAGDTLFSLSSTLACRYMSAFGGASIAADEPDGVIHFIPQEFTIISADSVAGHRDDIAGRIVLMGNINSEEDRHYTPLGDMNGTLIHAYAIDTMIDNPTRSMARHWVALIEILLLLLFVALYWSIFDACEKNERKVLLAVINWIYPVASAVLIIFLSGWLFISSHCYISPIILLASMALLPNMVELYIASKDKLLQNIQQLFAKLTTKKQKQ